MSNLGMYQVITTLAKKVGGPGNLIGILIGGGALLGGGGVYVGGKVKTKIKNNLDAQKKKEESAIIHTITKDGKSNEGKIFEVNDKFKVLELDGDAAMIEIMNDDNNPYFVSAKFLASISDYQ